MHNQKRRYTLIGVIVLLAALFFLMYYFFIRKSDIKMNYSTDKKNDYVILEGEKELITTQKYISDLNYTMRYDIDNFSVFKYKDKDIYRFLYNDDVLLMIEKTNLPSNCLKSHLDSKYNNCYIKLDDDKEEYYLSDGEHTYKILIKSPNSSEFEEGVKNRIKYMIKTFTIEDIKV